MQRPEKDVGPHTATLLGRALLLRNVARVGVRIVLLWQLAFQFSGLDYLVETLVETKLTFGRIGQAFAAGPVIVPRLSRRA